MSTDVENAIQPGRAVGGRRLRLQHGLLILLMAALVVVVRARWFSGASQAAAVTAPAEAEPVAAHATKPILDGPLAQTPAATASAEEPAQPTIFGSWRDDYYGERTMTFRPDGTGVMVIKLDSVGRAMIGANLLFNLSWENRDGVLVMQFTGGEPKAAVERISKLWGDRHEQKIELLTETDLHLRSTDSQNLYKLKHVDE